MNTIDDLNSQETLKFMTQELEALDKEKNNKEENKSKKNIQELEAEVSNTSKFMKNVIMLIVAQVLVKVFGLIYRIVIVNVPGFGDEGNGYYATGYEIYALLLAISSVGIPSVISKLVSERKSIGDEKGANRIFKIASKLFVSIGAILGLLLYLFADFISIKLLKVPDVALTLKVLAPAIMFVSWASVIRGYFSGLEDMKPTSISQTFEQLLNCTLTIALVYAVRGKEAYMMAAAGNLATTISVIIAFLYIFAYYKRNRIKKASNKFSKEDILRDRDIAKNILSLSIPITLSSLISILNTFIDTFTVSQGIQKALSGLYNQKEVLEQKAMEAKGLLSKINTIVGLPQAVNIAISTAIVPSISGFLAKGQKDKAIRRIKTSMNTTMLIVFPSVVGLFVLSDPILKLMYPSAPDGGLIMKILCIPTIFICFSHTVNGALQGFNDFKAPMIAVIVGAVIKILLNSILIPNPKIQVYGATISSVITQITAFAITYTILKKRSGYKLKIIEVLKPLMAAIMMGVCTFAAYYFLERYIGSNKAVLVSVFVALITYIPFLLLFNALDEDTINALPNNRIMRIIKENNRKREVIKRAKHIYVLRKLNRNSKKKKIKLNDQKVKIQDEDLNNHKDIENIDNNTEDNFKTKKYIYDKKELEKLEDEYYNTSNYDIYSTTRRKRNRIGNRKRGKGKH